MKRIEKNQEKAEEEVAVSSVDFPVFSVFVFLVSSSDLDFCLHLAAFFASFLTSHFLILTHLEIVKSLAEVFLIQRVQFGHLEASLTNQTAVAGT